MILELGWVLFIPAHQYQMLLLSHIIVPAVSFNFSFKTKWKIPVSVTQQPHVVKHFILISIKCFQYVTSSIYITLHETYIIKMSHVIYSCIYMLYNI